METLDLYPAAVEHAADGETTDYRKARVLTRDGRVRIVVDGRTGPEVAYDGEVVEVERLRGMRRYRIETVDGTLDVSRAAGCGCGSRLKRMTVEEAWA